MQKHEALKTLLVLCLFFVVSSSVSAEVWYISNGLLGAPTNLSTAMNQGFYYQYSHNFSNLTVATGTCGGGSEFVWAKDTSCNPPLIGNRTDFSIFKNHTHAWWHPSTNLTPYGIAVAFDSKGNATYSFNVSAIKAANANSSRLNFTIKFDNLTVIYNYTLAPVIESQANYSGIVNLTQGQKIYFILDDFQNGSYFENTTQYDTAGLLLNISSGNITISNGSGNGSNGSSGNETPLTGQNWAQFRLYLNNTGFTNNTAPNNLTLYATYNMGSPAWQLSVANGFVYVGTEGPSVKLYQLNASNVSQKISEFSLGGGGTDSGQFVTSQYLYTGSYNSRFYQLNATNVSQMIAEYVTGHVNVISTPKVWNGSMYGASYDGKLYQLNATNINQKLNEFTMSGGSDGTVAIMPIHSSIYIGDRAGYFYQLNISNISQVINRYLMGNIVFAAPTCDDLYCYIATSDVYDINVSAYYMFQFNATNITKVLNRHQTNRPIDASASLGNGYLYWGGYDGIVYQANATNITKIVNTYNTTTVGHWGIDQGGALTKDYFFIGSLNNWTYQLNATNISLVISKYEAGAQMFSNPVIANNFTYIASFDNNLYQFGSPANASGSGGTPVNGTNSSVNLLLPANNSLTGNSNINFSAQIIMNQTIGNATLYVWNSTNSLIATVRNLSFTENSTTVYFNVSNLGYQRYYWNVRACNLGVGSGGSPSQYFCVMNSTNFTFENVRNVSIQLYFFDEHNDHPLNYTNITIQVIHPFFSQNYTIENNNTVIFNYSLSDGEMEIRYQTIYHNARSYFLDFASTIPSTLELYSLNTTLGTIIVLQVVDENNNVVSGANIKALRYFGDDNAYKVVEISKTGVDGKTTMTLEPYVTWYKFIIEIDGVVYLSTIETKVTGSTLAFTLQLQENIYGSFGNYYGMYTNLSYSAPNFTYVWSDENIAMACLVVDLDTATQTYTVCNSCLSSSTGSLVCTINTTLEGFYVARGGIHTATNYSEYTAKDILRIFVTVSNNIADALGQRFSLFIAMLIIVTLALLGSWNPVVSSLFAVFGIIVTIFLGLWSAVAIASIIGWVVGYAIWVGLKSAWSRT